MTIRRAEPSDKPAMFLLARGFATSFAVEPPAFERSFHEILTHPEAFFANGRIGWVEEIMGSEAFQRQGVGRELMQAFETWAKEREAKQIALATRRASDFYEAQGYEKSAAYFRKKV